MPLFVCSSYDCGICTACELKLCILVVSVVGSIVLVLLYVLSLINSLNFCIVRFTSAINTA